MIEGGVGQNGINGKVDAASRRTAARRYCFLRLSWVAATSVTTIFAYRTLLDAARCTGTDEAAFFKTLALSVRVSNVCGVVILEMLPFLARRGTKRSLYFRLLSRAVIVAFLAVKGTGNSYRTLEYLAIYPSLPFHG